MPVRTILFRRLLPDRSIFDPEASPVARNVLPVAGTYRPLPSLTQLGTLSVAGLAVEEAILGAFAHVYQPSAPIQRMRPTERTGSTNWKLDDREDVEAGGDQTQQEVEGEKVGTEFFDDGAYLVSPGKPTNETIEFKLNTIQEPPDSAHFTFLRYRIVDPGDTRAWTVILTVESSAGGTIATLTETGTGEQDWTTAIDTLSAGEMTSLAAGDYTTEGQLTLKVDATLAGALQVQDPDEDVLIGGWTDEGAEIEDLYTKLTDASDATYVECGALAPATGPDEIRFGVGDFNEPASLANLAIILKWNSRNSGILTDFFLYASGVLIAKLEDVTPPTSATSETKSLTVESDIEFLDVDWEDVEIGIAPRYPIDVATSTWATFLPAADVDTDTEWTTEPLFSKINDSSDATFATSPTMGTESESFTVDLDQEPDVSGDTTREKKITIRARNNDGSSGHTLRLEILEDNEAVATRDHWLLAGSGFTDYEWPLANILNPSNTQTSTGWTPSAVHQSLDDDTNTCVSSGSAGDDFTVVFPDDPDFLDPGTTEGFLVRITGRVSSGGTTANLNVSLYQSNTLLEQISSAITLTDTEDTYVVVFSSDAVENFDGDYDTLRVKVEVVEAGPVVELRRLIFETPDPYLGEVTDFEGMRVRVTAVRGGGTGWTVDVSELDLQIAALRRIEVSEVDAQADADQFVELSWLQLQAPEASAGSLVGTFDKTAIVAARLKRLYLVDPQDTGGTVFTDISKGSPSDYTAGAYSWDFCSFGPENLLATNYEDAVQKFDPDSDTQTSDLITSSNKPKGRFIATARNQVMMGDINFSGSPNGKNDEIATSEDDDAALWPMDGTNGSIRQRLPQVPGQITGLQGGEFVLVWKALGLIRGSWINSPLYWRFDVISSEIGTTQPDSIIQVGATTYFYASNGRFMRTTGHEEPVPIDDGFHYDFNAPDLAFDHPLGQGERIRRVSSNYPHELQNRIFGAYDRGSKCCVWVYRALGNNPFENLRLAVYNVAEGRFSTGKLSGRGLSYLLQLPNTENDSQFQMYGLAGFTYSASSGEVRMEQFSGNNETVTLATPVTPVDNSSNDVGYIARVRPLLRLSSRRAYTILSKVSLTVKTWDDRSTEENARTEALTMTPASDSGWQACSLKGRFIQVELTLTPDLIHRAIKEIVGVQVEVENYER